MTTSRTTGRNSLFIRIREGHLQRCATDTNEHEKAQTATLDIEALWNIGRIVRATKGRINEAGGHDQDNTAKCDPFSSTGSGRAVTGPVGSEDTDSTKKEKR